MTREHDGKALAALILGIVSVALSLLVLAFVGAIFFNEDTQREFQRELERQEREQGR
ncbi:MAG: hypothetical protein M3N16_05995 [Actinomycetota bacterium]|nr:hypothetical protein [Actinomycetota bacterium]